MLISDKFKVYESRIGDNQTELSDNQLGKIQQNILSNENNQFKKKSCVDQFKFNSKVLGKFRDAETHATSETNQRELAQDISEGIKLINKRPKLIRMADASKLGWLVVEEYVSNPLASDEEDEKRINMAEARATKIAKQDRQKKLEKHRKTDDFRRILGFQRRRRLHQPALLYRRSHHCLADLVYALSAECPITGSLNVQIKNQGLKKRSVLALLFVIHIQG